MSFQPVRDYTGVGFFLTNGGGTADMNVDGSIGGTPDNIYIDDPTTNWTNTALSGTWDFGSTTITPQGGTESIEAINTVDGDQMQIEKSSTVDMDNFTAISGYLYLTSWNDVRHNIMLELRLAGVLQGNPLELNAFVDTGILNAWQQFIIPKASLGITDELIDQLVVTTGATTGSPPNYYLDTINIEQSGSRLFKFEVPTGKIFEVFSVNYTLIDNITVIEPRQLMGVASLTNGLTVQTVIDDETTFGASVKNISEIIEAGAQLDSTIIGATESMVNIIGLSPWWSRLGAGDTFGITVNDDLTGLISFRVIIRGRLADA